MKNTSEFKEVLDALKIFYKKVDPNKIPWTLIGSTSLILQDVNVPVSYDIDIALDSSQCNKVDKLIKEYRKQKPVCSQTDMYRSCYGKYEIKGVNIDLIGDYQYKKNGKWSPVLDTSEYEIMKIAGMKIRVLPLEKRLDEYQARHSRQKVSKIKKVLGFFKKKKN